MSMIHGAIGTRTYGGDPGVVAPVPAGTTYTLSVAGTITSSGVVIRQLNKIVAGNITSAGSLVRQDNKVLQGAISSSGVASPLRLGVTYFLSVAGTIASSGSLALQTGRALAGSISSVGALLNQASKSMAGSISSSGVIHFLGYDFESYAGSVSSSGALARQAAKQLAGAVATSGVVRRLITKSFAGSIASTGTLTTLAHRQILTIGVGVDSTGARLMTSTDGLSWTARTTPLDGASNFIYGVGYNGTNLWVAAGHNNTTGGHRVLTSPDGTTWTLRTSPFDSTNDDVKDVCWDPANNQWVAVGTSGKIATSPDGITWTARTAPTADQLNAVVANRSIIVAGGTGSDPIATSTDGVTWTQQSMFLNFANDVCWSEELALFVAVGASQTGTSFGAAVLVTSPDGITWTARATPIDHAATFGAAEGLGCCWSKDLGLFCVIGRHQPADPAIITSPDGITWTERTTPLTGFGNSNFGGCAWNGHVFIVTYQDQIITSPTGATWTTRTDPLAGGVVNEVSAGQEFPVGPRLLHVTGAIGMSGTLHRLRIPASAHPDAEPGLVPVGI
jgi:hypothetical protein